LQAVTGIVSSFGVRERFRGCELSGSMPAYETWYRRRVLYIL
jgi:hypothetical protein